MAVSGAYSIQSGTSKERGIFDTHRPAFQEVSKGILRISTKRSQNHEQKKDSKVRGQIYQTPSCCKHNDSYRYDGKTVTFWYGGHDGTRHFVMMTVREFIKAPIQHIPDRNFKMIRYYGAYSRRIKGKYSGYFRELYKTSDI